MSRERCLTGRRKAAGTSAGIGEAKPLSGFYAWLMGPAERMVAEQLRGHGITDERVLAAMGQVPREEFLPPSMAVEAYEGRALPIGAGQTISQPLVVAAMTQALAPGPEDSILEVGTGSGYQAAILGRLSRRVVTLELEPVLAERAAAVLHRLGIANVEVVVADGRLGAPAKSPFDCILVAAATPALPPALVEQLKEGGRLVLPLGDPGAEAQELRLYLKRAEGLQGRLLFPVKFVPLR